MMQLLWELVVPACGQPLGWRKLDSTLPVSRSSFPHEAIPLPPKEVSMRLSESMLPGVLSGNMRTAWLTDL